jgi:predicted metal-binding membrane protein
LAQTTALERALRYDRLVVLAGVASVVVLGWGYLLAGARMDMSMAGMAMAPMPWTPSYALLMFAMWSIMMVAMMVPSAAPMVLLFTTIKRKQEPSSSATIGAGIFLAGYLVVWGAFSLAATMGQWGLERAGLISMGMTSHSTVLAGAILLSAGLYQFTPLKRACLQYCQSPLLFLSSHWQAGVRGTFLMGVRHGAYCLGCCWFLMALLFIGGVMNLIWVAGIAIYVALERCSLAVHGSVGQPAACLPRSARSCFSVQSDSAPFTSPSGHHRPCRPSRPAATDRKRTWQP